jgi:pimeloyl-ACP methyl ester carboxylesterase
MKQVYLLSGLGADKRVFNYLDLKSFQTWHIEWEEPRNKESMEAYALRLTDQIVSKKPILIGVSFGGMIAIEIAKHIDTEKIILISSAKDRTQIPGMNRLISKLNLMKILPSNFLKTPNDILYWLFGTETDEEKSLLREIIKDTDANFLKWGMNKVGTWKNTRQFENVIQIHGTSDRIFPHQESDYKIENGGHFMIVNRAGQISQVINNLLS